MDDVAFKVDEINRSIAQHWREQSKAGGRTRCIQTAEADAPPADRVLITNRDRLGDNARGRGTYCARYTSSELASRHQNTTFACTHMVRMPLSVKSRFRKRPASVPFTLFCGTWMNWG